jgi:hypothetical protein
MLLTLVLLVVVLSLLTVIIGEQGDRGVCIRAT